MNTHARNFKQGDDHTAHMLADTSKTLWDIGEMVFGPGILVTSGFEPKGVICFDTPFGRVCVEINAAEMKAKEADARKVTLQQALQEVLARPRIKGVCFIVCTPLGVCFEVCL